MLKLLVELICTGQQAVSRKEAEGREVSQTWERQLTENTEVPPADGDWSHSELLTPTPRLSVLGPGTVQGDKRPDSLKGRISLWLGGGGATGLGEEGEWMFLTESTPVS